MKIYRIIQRAALLLTVSGMASVLSFSARAETLYIGDAAAQGKNLTVSSTNANTHGLSNITYVFFGNNTDNDNAYSSPTFNTATYNATFANNTGAALTLALTEVNFYTWNPAAGAALTPFVAIYSGDFTQKSIETKANYNVIAIGDAITVAAGSDKYNEAFTFGGGNSEITLGVGQILVAGCYVNGSNFLRLNGDDNPITVPKAGSDNTADYIAGAGNFAGYTLPVSGSGALTADSNYTKFRQNVMFNIGFEIIPEPSTWALLLTGAAALAACRRKRAV